MLYAEQAEVTLVSYAIDDGPVKIWDILRNERMPKDLHDAIRTHTLVAHNSWFDRNIFQITGLFGDVELGAQRWVDTMVQAYCHGLPGSLDTLSTIYKLGADKRKDKRGKQLIRLFCIPQPDGSYFDETTHPEQWKEFRIYAMSDIHAMRELHKLLPKWNYPGVKYLDNEFSQEHAQWVYDQRMNNRGFAIDADLIEAAVQAEIEERAYLNSKTVSKTDGNVSAATQRDEMLKYLLEAHGFSLPDMRADTIKRRIEDPGLPAPIRELLELRLASSRNTAAKYRAALNVANSDHRVRGTLQFCGAATTGRWAARMVQPQNLMRPTMKQSAIDTAISDIKSGAAPLLYSDLTEVLGNCVRGMIMAGKNKKLCAADLSSIEGRGLAWLAGEQYIVDFYKKVDRKEVDYDSYMLTYASVFAIDPWLVTKAERTLGKPIELGLGYGGGVAAFLTFAMVYHIDLAEAARKVWEVGDQHQLRECLEKYKWAKENGYHAGLPPEQYAAFEYIKQRWRASRPLTVKFWGDLEEAFRNATLAEGETFTVGKLKFNRKGQWLRMRLPSGRLICFLQPRYENGKLSYLGLDRYTRKWGRVPIYGGKLSGLSTQAFAGDVIREPIPDLEQMGYGIVLLVHDEIIAEVSSELTVQGMIDRMTAPKIWAPGLPLSASGFEATRYRKE